MLKRSITYENPFTGEKVTEEHYFHVSKADLVEMQLEEHNTTYIDKKGHKLVGMQAKIQRMTDSEDGRAIMTEIKDIIRRAYGVRDGDQHRKTKEISDEFLSSAAFSQLFFELCTDPTAAADFINAVIPSNLDEIASEIQVRAEKAAQQHKYLQAASEPNKSKEQPETAVSDEASSQRKREIASATSEYPVTLTRNEIIEMGDEELKTGISEGRYKLSQS